MKKINLRVLWKKRFKIVYFSILTIAVLSILILIFSRKGNKGIIVAKVNNYYITLDEVLDKFGNSPQFYKNYVKENPEVLVQDYINQVLLFQKAKKYERRYKEKLKKLLKFYYQEILVKEFIEDEVVKKEKISEEEIKNYYNTHLSEFTIPEMIRLREIVTATQSEAESILNRLILGEDFAEIAKKESISPSRENGGDLGWLKKDEIDPQIRNLVFNMEKGQILGKIIKTKMGYHIIKVEGKREKRIQSLEEASPYIKEILLSQKKRQMIEEYIDKLRKENTIKIFSENLKYLKERLK